MPAQKFNARDCEFQIEDYLNPGTWVAFRTATAGSGKGGINTFSLSHEYETTDTTTFGSDGRAESQNMQEGKGMTLEGFKLKDPSTGALDPAMALAEAQAARLGDESLCGFRFAAPGDTTWEVWAESTWQLGDQGGGNNDKTGWAVTVTRSGPSTTAAKP
ncbi:phage tail tube protein [Streptomyces sp. NPDC058674]|uniref:phage tail tube protein n=1 Tax=Streptomyces sp. NPDC058674 TaxID=3346592 RepID=UPI00365FCFF7